MTRLTDDDLRAVDPAAPVSPKHEARALLAEVDALRAERDNWCYASKQADVMIGNLRARAEQAEQERDHIKATYTQCDLELWEEREALRARIATVLAMCDQADALRESDGSLWIAPVRRALSGEEAE